MACGGVEVGVEEGASKGASPQDGAEAHEMGEYDSSFSLRLMYLPFSALQQVFKVTE
jgi:hypothetical protein